MNLLKQITFLGLFSIVILTSCRHSCINSSEGWDYYESAPDQNCYENGKLTAAQRMMKYPFNTAKEVRIISFDDHYNPLKGDSIDVSLIKESFTLNTSQINQLTNVLYNFNFSKTTSHMNSFGSDCYWPRHAVLFYDSNGKMIEFMEFCFQCTGKRSSDKKVEMGEFCEGKYELLEAFFKKCGITKFGGIKEDNPELR